MVGEVRVEGVGLIVLKVLWAVTIMVLLLDVVVRVRRRRRGDKL